MTRKGVVRLSAGYILMFIEILLLFNYRGAVNPFALIFKGLSFQSSPVLWCIGLFFIGVLGLGLAVWGGIDYKATGPKAVAPADLTKAGDMYRDAKGREYFYDNAKFILIFLVVLAHAISPFKSMEATPLHNGFMLLWRVINTMHMPCLIFISGFLAKKYIRPDGGINVQRPFTYMVYYLAAQLTVGAFEVFVLGDSISKSILAPRSSLWFLVCLIWWYLLLPVIDKIDPKIMLTVAVIFGLLIGYDEKVSNLMAMSRMIVHFPFFLTGYYLSAGKMQFLFTKKAKLLSVGAFLLAMISQVGIFYLFRTDGGFNFSINAFITCDRSYFSIFKNSDVSFIFWFLPRVWFYACAVLLCFAFLVWVPRKKNIFTGFGARTLSVYILHRYLYLSYLEFEWFNFRWLPFEVSPTVAGLLMIVISALLTILLSLYPCYLPFELLGRLKIKPFLKKPKEEIAK